MHRCIIAGKPELQGHAEALQQLLQAVLAALLATVDSIIARPESLPGHKHLWRRTMSDVQVRFMQDGTTCLPCILLAESCERSVSTYNGACNDHMQLLVVAITTVSPEALPPC